MSPVLISILLWIPFVLTVLVAGTFFCITGYRKGIWRALIALGAVVVAALVSMLLANLAAMLLAPALTNLVMSMAAEPAGTGMSILALFIRSGVQVALSMGLFSLLMLVLTIVFRFISYRIKRKALITKGKGLKLGGMAVGAAAAVLFTFLWMLPLYGSLAAYAPVVDTLMDTALSSSSSSSDPTADILKAYIEAVVQQPLVKTYNTVPAKAAYGGIAQVSAGDSTVSVATMADTVQTLTDKVSQIAKAPAEQKPAMTKELVDYIRSDVITQSWCYAMFRETISQLRDAAEQILAAAPSGSAPYTSSTELPYTASALSAVSSDIPATEGSEGDVFYYYYNGAESDGTFSYDFDGDGIIISPDGEQFVVEGAIPEGDVTVAPNAGMGSIFDGTAVAPDTYTPDAHDIKIAKLLLEFTDIMDVTREEFISNCDNLLGFVSYGLEHDLITIMNDEDISRLYETGIMEKAGQLANSSEEAVRIKRLIAIYVLTNVADTDYDTAEAFLDRYPITQLTDTQQQLVEAELIFNAMAFERMSPVDFLLKHPSFGAEALTEVLGDTDITALAGLSSWQQSQMAQYLVQDPELPQKLLEEVKKNAGTPGAPTLDEYFNAMCLVLSCSGVTEASDYEDPHPAALDFALEYVGKIPFVRGGEETEQLYALLVQYSAAQEDSPYAYRGNDGFSMLTDMMRDGTVSGDLGHATWYTRCILDAESTWNVIERSLAVYGDDPIKLSKSLSKDYRKELGEVFSSFSENFNRFEPDVVAHLAGQAGMTVEDYLAMMQQRADKLKVFFACP